MVCCFGPLPAPWGNTHTQEVETRGKVQRGRPSIALSGPVSSPPQRIVPPGPPPMVPPPPSLTTNVSLCSRASCATTLPHATPSATLRHADGGTTTPNFIVPFGERDVLCPLQSWPPQKCLLIYFLGFVLGSSVPQNSALKSNFGFQNEAFSSSRTGEHLH